MDHTVVIQMEFVPAENDILQINVIPDQHRLLTPLQYEIDLSNLDPFQTFIKDRNTYARIPDDIGASTRGEYHDKLEACGTELHDAIFGQIQESWDKIVNKGRGSYILQVPSSLWWLPWELLYHADLKYLDSTATPIVRQVGRELCIPEVVYLDTPSLCFFLSDPTDHPTRADRQYEVMDGISRIIGNCRVVPRGNQHTGNEKPLWERLFGDLQQSAPDILHIVAHGKGKDGVDIEDESPDDEIHIPYIDLVNLLIQVSEVKVLIVAACRSGDFFASNPHLVQRLFDHTELKAVVLMASTVSAKALIEFTRLFYTGLLFKYDVATAVAYARSQLRKREKRTLSLEWSSPMVYESLPVNPFAKSLDRAVELGSVAPLPFVHLESAQAEARNILKGVTRLAELLRQVQPTTSSIAFATSEIDLSCRRYRRVVSKFDQHYAPEDEFLLDSIRLVNSQVFPAIDRFTKATKSSDGHKAITASEYLVERLDEAVDLILEKSSEAFQSLAKYHG